MEMKDSEIKNKRNTFRFKYKVLIALIVVTLGIAGYVYMSKRPIVLKNLDTEVFTFYPGNLVNLKENKKLYGFTKRNSSESINGGEKVDVVIFAIPDLELERRLYPDIQNIGYQGYTESEIQAEIMDMITTDYEYQK
ncbi:hypothetical protein AB6884_10320 [Carnobacterium maltaromaticum]|uniref:hypothetical protein n=1 Tax=Carnobacterium maltaromaticum TaxID=2751 RepID=UPI0039BE8B53